MVGQLSLAILVFWLNFGCSRGGDLWCYQCNTDLRDGHTTECNDPYIPAPHFDLVRCSQNESHHCLKSVITYRDVLVTVRGCVPSREIDGYCRQEKYFPESNIVCSFCNDYACNGQGSLPNSGFLLFFISMLIYLYRTSFNTF